MGGVGGDAAGKLLEASGWIGTGSVPEGPVTE